jgi:hypothetical protein
MATTSGVAGRTNYAKWDRVASDLIEEVEEEEKKARVEDKAAVGLDGKYAVSAAQAEERTKLNKVQATKKKLEQFQKREQAVVQTLTGLFGDDEKEPSSSSSTTVRVTRKDLEAGKRVVSIGDTEGRSWKDTIVLTADLSLMESQLGQQPAAKSFATDVENDAAPLTQPRSVFGVIKVFLTNLKNCTVRIKCKIISGCVEMHRCENVQIIIEGGPVATLQADLSSDITVLYRDAPSGKSDSTNGLYWGESPDDRIFHAGVSNFTITVERDGVMESSIQSDFIKDGAVAVGNAKPEEYQFVTSVVDGQLLTESVVRAGATTGTNARAMTQRELLEEEKRRREAEKMVVAMADSMIQIKDKDGNVLVKKEKVETTPNDDVVEEVMTEGVKDVVAECDQNKARGNEAFGAGEYGQASWNRTMHILWSRRMCCIPIVLLAF